MSPTNHKTNILLVFILALLPLATAQSRGPAINSPAHFSGSDASTPVAITPAPDHADALWSAYNAAVEHSAVWRNEDLRRLKPAVVGADGKIWVATATRYDGQSPLYGDTWVTIIPELQNLCRQFTGDVAMQVRAVLGLPPDKEIPKVVTMKVQPADIFRPTPDPDPWTLCPCGDPEGNACRFNANVQCGNKFPSDASSSHIQWIATTTLAVRQTPGGYPWTHLGYTYNWKPGADPYGTSEYVVRKGAIVTDVATTSLDQYCKPAE
ncbi:MAG TPA: hypothetical protein VND65_05455 [Candidatus Binatia bacterium]|nr:hypothetical protein [Candidatus Binatia bacterium]